MHLIVAHCWRCCGFYRFRFAVAAKRSRKKSSSFSVSLMEKLSAQALSEFKEVFSMFDRDGDGTIDASELGVVMQSLGVKPTEEEVLKMVEEVDLDHNGTIDFSEFCNLMVSKAEGIDPDDELQTVFESLDFNKDGYIDIEDLEQSTATVQWGETVRREDLEKMISNWESSESKGRLSLEDFRRIIRD
jgi:calmodulin